jgi:hypothetical protein
MAAEQTLAGGAEAFPHIRIVMGMVIGLGVTRLLSGMARIVQHPTQYRLYPVHLAWAASVLLMLVHFWWWEFGLYGIAEWSFGIYLFIIGYAVLLFLLAALLFPDSMLDYSSYEDFFISRRAWFFAVMALTYLFDVIDTLIKGEAHFARFGSEYLVRTPLLVALCVAAAWTSSRRFHAAFVVVTLAYQISWIARLFGTIA